MTSPRPDRSRASIGRGAKWLIGIVVVAVVGALAPVVVSWLLPPEEVEAKLSNVSIDREVSLQDYAIRHGAEHASARGAGAIALIAATRAQEDTTTGGGTGTGGETTTTTGTETTTTTTGGETTTTGGETTTTAIEETDGVLRLRLAPADARRVNAGVRDALERPDVPEVAVPPVCLQDATDEGCGLTSLQMRMEIADEDGAVGDVSTQTVARRLAQVFRGTRTRPATTDPTRRELVGVTVNFNVAMTGLRGDTADVRWSLYSGRRTVRVPRPWLRNQRALLLRADAERESASGEFWVPIPQARGPFFIRIGVYAGDTRLDYADTPRFR
ncbi:MAG TPA: hypothetical protein VM299_03855 [Solirubrobacteraceae bacterium]|jgi:hypothetical protein|nr:hypothetical protein [Solirubrobacteraceae bacterium]